MTRAAGEDQLLSGIWKPRVSPLSVIATTSALPQDVKWATWSRKVLRIAEERWGYKQAHIRRHDICVICSRRPPGQFHEAGVSPSFCYHGSAECHPATGEPRGNLLSRRSRNQAPHVPRSDLKDAACGRYRIVRRKSPKQVEVMRGAFGQPSLSTCQAAFAIGFYSGGRLRWPPAEPRTQHDRLSLRGVIPIRPLKTPSFVPG
jgi:hypothetical protein